jgi:hypothetical protein
LEITISLSLPISSLTITRRTIMDFQVTIVTLRKVTIHRSGEETESSVGVTVGPTTNHPSSLCQGQSSTRGRAAVAREAEAEISAGRARETREELTLLWSSPLLVTRNWRALILLVLKVDLKAAWTLSMWQMLTILWGWAEISIMSTGLAWTTLRPLKIPLTAATLLTFKCLPMALRWEVKVAVLLILSLKKWLLKILKMLKMEAITSHHLQQLPLQ